MSFTPQVIKANDDLTPEHHQFFLYQMLRGLKYIHSGEGKAAAGAAVVVVVVKGRGWVVDSNSRLKRHSRC